MSARAHVFILPYLPTYRTPRTFVVEHSGNRQGIRIDFGNRAQSIVDFINSGNIGLLDGIRNSFIAYSR